MLFSYFDFFSMTARNFSVYWIEMICFLSECVINNVHDLRLFHIILDLRLFNWKWCILKKYAVNYFNIIFHNIYQTNTILFWWHVLNNVWQLRCGQINHDVFFFDNIHDRHHRIKVLEKTEKQWFLQHAGLKNINAWFPSATLIAICASNTNV